MKIQRKPRRGGQWSQTDAKDPLDLVEDWKPGTTYVLDGTIDKEGSRHSLIGIDISGEDVQALLIKLMESYKLRIQALEEACDKLAIENDQRKAAFQRLEKLIDPYIHPDLFTAKSDPTKLMRRLYELSQFGISENLHDLEIPGEEE